MVTRIRIKGYKSLVDVDVELKPMSLLIGPNAAGKSNLLDALQILSKLGTSRTLDEAFDPPYRGKPLESFHFGGKGLAGLIKEERLRFSIEADLQLSDAVVKRVNQQIRVMRSSNGNSRSEGGSRPAGSGRDPVRERNLRYRIEIEMLPGEGVLRVADEHLAALTEKGEPNLRRLPFIEQIDRKLRLRFEGQARPTSYDLNLNQSILSMPHYPPHYPHLTAVRQELESWLFFYFEPRELMRAANPVRETRRIGSRGEALAAFLNTLKARKPEQFGVVEKALRLLIPAVDGIDVGVNDLGEVELHLKEGGIAVSSRVVSDGTLRMLGLLALPGMDDPPALVAVEEPENGVHPRLLELIAEFLHGRASQGATQYLVTTHSLVLPDLVPGEWLYVVRRVGGRTDVDPFSRWGPLGRIHDIDQALEDPPPSELPVSERILRGDLDA